MDQRTTVLLAGVVGVGVIIGTSGLFLYRQLLEERKRGTRHQHQIHRLDKAVAELRAEVVDLQEKHLCNADRALRKKAATPSTDTKSECDVYSTVGTDDEDDEFLEIFDEVVYESPPDPMLEQLYGRCDLLLFGSPEDKRAAHADLLDHLEVYPDCPDLLWRLARSCSCMAAVHQEEGEADEKKKVILRGIFFANRALALEPDNVAAHQFHAILTDKSREFRSTREKIADMFFQFNRHVDRTLGLHLDNPTLSHLQGRFKKATTQKQMKLMPTKYNHHRL